MRIEIREAPGNEVGEQVNTLYARLGSQGVARPTDYFFLAYTGNELIGAVRYCLEQQTSMLRTMMIDERFRRQGIGQSLLQRIASYLERNQIHETYCVPYRHLEAFYGSIGFKTIEVGGKGMNASTLKKWGLCTRIFISLICLKEKMVVLRLLILTTADSDSKSMI